jgi:3-hydroxybutyrate dehydrogenase
MNLAATGLRVLVTAGAAGIGRAIAQTFVDNGARVHACDVDERALAALPEKISKTRADVANLTDVNRLFEDVARHLGGLDVLVNNAGIQFTASVEAFPPERWDAVIATNLSAAFHATRLALPGMRAKGWGRIVNTASVHGLVASVQKAAYVAAKHGIIGLTKVVALETAGSGITCNAICPGWTRTELVEPQIAARAQAKGLPLEEGARDLLAEKQPSRQFVTVDQLGEVVVFLCSDAASQITGASIPVDGGWTAQ